MGENRKSSLKTALVGVTISLLAIFIIFKFTETQITWRVILKANSFYIALALFLHFLFWLFWALRIMILSSFLNAKIDIKYALEMTLASNFLAAITPSSAGGEPLRVKMLTDKGVSIGSASAIVLAERLMDAIFFIIALLIFIIISGFSTKFGMEVGLVFFVSLVLFILFLYYIFKDPENIDKIAEKLYKILKRFIKGKKADQALNFIKDELFSFRQAAINLVKNPAKNLIILFFTTSLIWFSDFLVPSAILLALNEDPVILLSITSQLILVIVSLIPITPGASGIVEAGMAYLYSRFLPSHILGVLIGTWRAITYFSNLIVGFIVNVRLLKSRYLD